MLDPFVTGQGLEMLAQVRLLLDQMLARAQQVPVLFQGWFGNADKREQAMGVELRQLGRINAIGFEGCHRHQGPRRRKSVS